MAADLTDFDNHFAVLEERLTKLDATAGRVELLAAVLNALNNVVVVADPGQPDCPLIYVNKNFTEITGYSFEEAVGLNCRFLQGEDRDQPGVKQLHEDIKAERPSHVTLRNYRKDGTMFWNELYISPVRDHAGKVVLFTGVQNDITEQQMLKEETQRLAAALKQVNEAVLITDPYLEGPGPRIIYTNYAFKKMTGYDADEVEGKSPRLLQGDKTSPVVLDRLRSATREGEPFRGEAINYRKDGSEYIVEWNIAPVFDKDGTLSHWVSAQRDVTERRHLERQLLSAAQDGRRRLATDLHDTVQQHLIATRLTLKSVLKAARQPAVDRKEIAAQLEEVSELLKEAVQQVRNVSRGLEATELGPSGLMLALQELTRTTNRLKNIDCSFEYEKPVLINDAERAEHLYRIAQEGVGNALKHADAARITISLAEHPQGHALRIRDDGKGFSDAVIESQQLRTVRYRVNVLGAALTLLNASEGGAIVEVVFSNQALDA